MSYVLVALVAGSDVFGSRSHGLFTVDLAQGVTMAPIATDIAEARSPDATSSLGSAFHSLPAGIEQLALDLSREGPVAYLESEHFGGTGEEAAVVWSDGRVVVGPLTLTTVGGDTSLDSRVRTAWRSHWPMKRS